MGASGAHRRNAFFRRVRIDKRKLVLLVDGRHAFFRRVRTDKLAPTLDLPLDLTLDSTLDLTLDLTLDSTCSDLGFAYERGTTTLGVLLL